MIASWTICTDFEHQHRRIRSDGQLLATWSGFNPTDTPTLCFREADAVWIVRANQGGIRFTQHKHDLYLYPKEGTDAEQFKRMAFHDWLPFVYNFWGLQVLHASAAFHSPTRRVVAFSGLSGAGKSTFGFGLGCLPHWRQIADDSLAFTAELDSLRLLPIPNEALLRPASAHYYGDREPGSRHLDWVEGPLSLKQIYFLEPTDDLEAPVCLLRVSRGRGYMLLLPQAYTLALDTHSEDAALIERPQDNRQQMVEYLSLASQVSVFRLQYPRKFTALEEALSLIENDLLSDETQ